MSVIKLALFKELSDVVATPIMEMGNVPNYHLSYRSEIARLEYHDATLVVQAPA